MKSVFKILGGLLLFFLLIFIIDLFVFGEYAFFAPKKQNLERNIYENTKSYVHGKVQDLAKYYEEYQEKKDPQDREAIRQLIIMNFADFNSNAVNNIELRNFLIKMRGY